MKTRSSALLWAILVSSSVVAPGVAASERGEVRLAPAPVQLADFELTDQDGRAFRFSQRKHGDAVVFFGFTHCPDVCPTTLHKLKLLTDALGKEGSSAPAVIMISVDGDRDTPAALKGYLATDFIGLTGDPRKVRAIAAEFSAVFFKGLPADDSANYLVEHTSQVYLVDAGGRLRATFFDASVERMSTTIRSLHP
jgi:cytochrome oxidase Cu insertion factor (SCO1/SenC/PrrC family)